MNHKASTYKNLSLDPVHHHARRFPPQLVVSIMVVTSLFCFIVFALFFSPILPTHAKKEWLTPLGVPYEGSPVSISKKIHHTSHIQFKENDGWLGMELDAQYVAPVFAALNSTKQPLKNRGEAHITVLTPPEFTTLQSANVTLQEVNDIARNLHIQSTQFNLVCVGKETLIKDGVDNTVYQLIVTAPNLVKIREAIFRLFYSRGGNPALFDPRAFWPHVTVGFTVNDLFEQDGIHKGYNACHRPLKEIK